MMTNTSNAGLLLVDTLFGLVIIVLLLRFLLQLMKVDFYNPISRLISRVSDPILTPIRSLLPSTQRIDSASLVVMVLLQFLQLLSITTITAIEGVSVNLLGLLILAITKILSLSADILFWSIIILAILSWLQPRTQHPGITLLQQLTDPLIRPIRQRLPITSGVDFSPFVVLLAINLVEFIVIAPLKDSALMLFV